MAVTSKLSVWNAALREIGAAPIVSTTDANTSQYTLNAAWDHAVEHVLAMEDWGFARRRSSIAGVSNTAFPPYTYSYTKPADYLRKCWFKLSAADEAQADHAEIAATFYGFSATILLEYISDHADNYDPANWPPHFTRVVTLYLASLIAPKLARAGSGDIGMLDGKMGQALAEAKDKESLFLVNVSIAQNKLPVMRRALEFLGQQLAGSMTIHAHTDMLRWHMNRSWDHALKYVLEMGAWNFATRRAVLEDGTVTVPGGEVIGDIIEGYSNGTETDTTTTTDTDVAGWVYGYTLPTGFLHKIWIKANAYEEFEIRHQFMSGAVYTNVEPVVLEYIAWDDDSTDPANWTANFLEAVAAYLALLVSPSLRIEDGRKGVSITANEMRSRMEAVFAAKLSDAKLRDAIQQEPKALPPGRFVRARLGGWPTSLRRLN